jgi:hypothetical protein
MVANPTIIGVKQPSDFWSEGFLFIRFAKPRPKAWQ